MPERVGKGKKGQWVNTGFNSWRIFTFPRHFYQRRREKTCFQLVGVNRRRVNRDSQWWVQSSSWIITLCRVRGVFNRSFICCRYIETQRRSSYGRSEVKVAQSCPTLCNSMDYTVPGILQARILDWGAVCFSRVSSQPRDRIWVSCIAGGFCTICATREAQEY